MSQALLVASLSALALPRTFSTSALYTERAVCGGEQVQEESAAALTKSFGKWEHEQRAREKLQQREELMEQLGVETPASLKKMLSPRDAKAHREAGGRKVREPGRERGRERERERKRERGPGGLTREVETPLPSTSPHDPMILREDLVDSHGRWKRPRLQTAHMTIWY